jgi:hypothetical protein
MLIFIYDVVDICQYSKKKSFAIIWVQFGGLMKRLVLLFVLFSNGAFALERYFANEEIQRLAPEAFALQPEASEFHQEIIHKAKKSANLFYRSFEVTNN